MAKERKGDDARHGLIGRNDLERYLREVGQHINQQGLRGELLLLGGAFMTLVLQRREATKDVDAYFSANAQAIRDAAAIVAQEHGLPSDWLNDAVKGFLYRQPESNLWLDVPGLRIYTPEPAYIFAMKAVAGRPEDIRDLRDLIRILGYGSADQALSVVGQYVPERLLTPRIQYLIEDLFDEGD